MATSEKYEDIREPQDQEQKQQEGHQKNAHKRKQTVEGEKSTHKSSKKAKDKAGDKEKDKLKESLKAAEGKNHELQDKYLRLSAEFDNYRKRTLKEKAEMIKTASEELLKRIIPVLDDLERGLQVVDQAKDPAAVKEGMMLIYGRFKDFLHQNGIKEIEAIHQDFDTDLHDAVTKIPAQDKKMKGKVVDVIEKGYFLHDKVIRYPKVVVGE